MEVNEDVLHTVKTNFLKWLSRFTHILHKLIVLMLCVTTIKLRETRHSAMDNRILKHIRV